MSDEILKSVSLDELPLYSPWPARLISMKNLALSKTPEKVKKEFGTDKWGSLLKHFVDKEKFTLIDVLAKEQDLDQRLVCFQNTKGFFLTKTGQAIDLQLEIYADAIKEEVDDASCLVELGAGYGAKILGLSEKSYLKNMPLYAAEYTLEGCDMIKLISEKIDKHIQVGKCDFNNLELTGFKIPENAIIFTSYSIHYSPLISQGFVEFLMNFKPKAIFHFEPCYEHHNTKSIYGLMCKRYIEINGYTKNIASQIEESCIGIGAKFNVKTNIFGANPFLPFSIIKLTPQS